MHQVDFCYTTGPEYQVVSSSSQVQVWLFSIHEEISLLLRMYRSNAFSPTSDCDTLIFCICG